MNENLYALFHSRFPADKSKTFLETESGRVITVGELEETAARYAGYIRALGVAPENVLHVGDDATLDALAALNAGMQSA